RGQDGCKSALNPSKGILNRKWIDREIAEIGGAMLGKWIDAQNRIPRPNDCRLIAHPAWTESRARTIRCASVKRYANNRNIQLGRVGDVRQPHECRHAGEARIFQSIDRLWMRKSKRPADLGHRMRMLVSAPRRVNALAFAPRRAATRNFHTASLPVHSPFICA